MSGAFRDAGSGCLSALRVWTRTGGDAPELASRGELEVVFDGELHNRTQLGAEFGSSVPRTAADTVLEAYLRWGEEAFAKLRGVFALVLWDGTRRTLLCVRDALGTYPLYYAETGAELLVSASSEALLSHPSVSRNPSPVWLVDRIRHIYPDPGLTQHQAVRRVMPGHLLKSLDGATESHRYWFPMTPGASVDWIREGALEGFGELLERKIGDYVGDAQAGVFLSGGLDSISVAGLARDHCRRAGTPVPWGLSLQFSGGGEADESSTQSHVAGVLGMPLLLLPFDETVGGRGLVASALELSASLPAPLLNPWLPAYVELGRRGRAEGCEVILTGGGGDEWLTVNTFLAADLIRKLDVGGLIDLYRSKKRDYRMSHPEALRCLLWTCGLRPLLRDGWDASPLRQALRASVRQWLQGAQPAPQAEVLPWFVPDPALRSEVAARSVPDAVLTPDYYFRSMWQTLNHPVMSAESEELFEYGTPHGFVVRRPYWDAEAIEYLCRVPPRMLNSGQRSKGLVRRLLATRFPDFGVERQVKVNAARFFQERVLKEAPQAWARLGGLRSLAELGVVDAAGSERYFQQVVSGNLVEQADRTWTLLCLESWLRPRI